MAKRRKVFNKIISFFMIVVLLISMESPSFSQAATKKAPALSAKKLKLKVGKSKKLKVVNVKKKQIKTVKFTSNKKKVAKVNSSGKVTGVKAGTAKITCKLALKNKKKYTLKCTVKVSKGNNTSGDDEDASGDSTEKPLPPAVVTTAPTESKAPDVTPTAGTATTEPGSPGVTENPSGSDQPVVTEEPTGSDQPAVTKDPSGSDQPAVTDTPTESDQPAPATTSPSGTSQPEVTPYVHQSVNGITTMDTGVMRSDMSAFDIVHDMGLGINLGNTMEACGVTWISNPGVSDFETAWQKVKTTQEVITGMKNAGFHSIRIPVSWSNMMSTDGKYTINEEYFDRVETIMNYAFNERMYVIVNIHFDSGWWARFGSLDADERSEAMNKYKTMWTQIANRYKEYSDYLIFESANEELGTRLNSTDDYSGSGYFTSEDQLYEKTNEINQTFVDIVRGTGGNNSTRHLLIAGYDTDISKTCDSRYQMPTDTVSDRLMVSIHYYSPSTYCISEKEDNSWGYLGSWGTDADIAAMKSELSNMKIIFANKGIPVIIGEYGVCDTKLSDDSLQRKEGRDIFYKEVSKYALNNGMCPMLWDTGSAYDRTSGKMTNATEAANYLELEQLAESNPVFEPALGKSEFSWNGTIGSSGWNPVAPVAGDDCDFAMTSVGGCYKISGVDWSKFSSPVLKLHADSLTGSAGYELGTTVDDTNVYYITIKDVQKTETWTFSADETIDLSTLNLSDSSSLYIRFNCSEFSGLVKLTISEK